MDGRIFYLKRLLLERLNHHWTIEEMAEVVELSSSHFQKLFKTQRGISPAAYLHNLRLEKACELLESTFHSVKEIGNEIGLTDSSHFTRDFKSKFGATPTEYRNNHWNKIQKR